MPEALAASGSLQEVDVGFNALTAMPSAWVQGNASDTPLAYIGMDSNAITVRFPTWMPSNINQCQLEGS